MNPDPGLASWLKLALTPGIGPATLRRVLRQFGLPHEVLARPRRELEGFLAPEVLARLQSDELEALVARVLAWAAEPAIDVVEGALDLVDGLVE